MTRAKTARDPVNFDGYRRAVDEGTPRQLARLKYDVTPDAYDQLREAFIFHWRPALSVLKWELAALVTGRCNACGNRHIVPLTNNPNRKVGSLYYCGYGWRPNPVSALVSAWLTGRHGMD